MKKLVFVLYVTFMLPSFTVACTEDNESKYLGCFREADRKLKGFSFKKEDLTTDECLQTCQEKGYLYAALMQGDVCYCSGKQNILSVSADPADCNITCRNDGDKCGGPDHASVYGVRICGQAAPLSKPGFFYMGCYKISRTMAGKDFISYEEMSYTYCTKMCNREGYLYGSLTAGHTCHCSNEHKSDEDRLPDSECDIVCTGDSTFTCGGKTSEGVLSVGICNHAPYTDMNSKYKGCYKGDSGKPTLNGYRYKINTLGIEDCLLTCRSREFMYAAIYAGKVCACGDNIVPDRDRVPEDQCKNHCWNENWSCGAFKRFNLYWVANNESNGHCKACPTAPLNSVIKCSGRSGCQATCLLDYVFINGERQVDIVCEDGSWKVKGNTSITTYKCHPMCTPACQNGGTCIGVNTCDCPQQYRGPQCQYNINVCDRSKLNFNGNYNCSETGGLFSCVLSCPAGMYFESTPAAVYTCDYSQGVFVPCPAPLCFISPIEKKYPIYMGCYRDAAARKLTGHFHADIFLTPKKCVDKCNDFNFLYAAVEAGNQCFCGNEVPQKEDKTNSQDCNYKCGGDKSKNCGGWWRMAVYRLGKCQKIVPIEREELGCYTDAPARRLNGHFFVSGSLTPQKCINECQSRNHRYAAVEAKNQCFCGNEVPQKEDKRKWEECDWECSGDKYKFCGAWWRMYVYKVGVCNEYL